MTTFFCAEEISSKKLEKNEVFLNLEVKTIQPKTKATALETYFGLGKIYDTNQREAKVKATATIRFPLNIFFTSTKILNGEEFTAASRKAYCERWKIKMQIFVPKSFHSTSVGCRSPVQWLLCFIAMF